MNSTYNLNRRTSFRHHSSISCTVSTRDIRRCLCPACARSPRSRYIACADEPGRGIFHHCMVLNDQTGSSKILKNKLNNIKYNTKHFVWAPVFINPIDERD